MNISTHTITEKLAATQATGTDDFNSGIVDTQNCEGVQFFASVGAAAADTGVKIQQGDQPNLSDAIDLPDTLTLSDGTQTDFVVDVYRPTKRYLRVVVVRPTTTTTIESIWAIRYSLRRANLDANTTTAQAATLSISPDEAV